MKILFIGDVVGKPGLRLLSELIPIYKKEGIYDLILVNGENAAGGFGLTGKSASKLNKYGCDLITTGNPLHGHSFSRLRKNEVYIFVSIKNNTTFM